MAVFGKLKQIKDLRQQAKEVQGQLTEIKGAGEAEHGNISVVINGNQKIESININEELLDPSKKEAVQSGIISAHEKAVKQIQKTMADQMRKGDLEMPDLNLR